MSNIIKIAIAVPLLLSSSALFAHHGVFYKKIFRAIENADLEDIRNLFSESAWEGKDSAMSAKQLQERLQKGRVRELFENSEHDKQRKRCLVAFNLEYPDKTVEPIWLLAEDFDPRFREWDWLLVRIVNEEREAQAFFKHSYAGEFSPAGMTKPDANSSEDSAATQRQNPQRKTIQVRCQRRNTE